MSFYLFISHYQKYYLYDKIHKLKYFTIGVATKQFNIGAIIWCDL